MDMKQLLGTPTEFHLRFIRNEDARRYLAQLPQNPRQSLSTASPHVHPLAIDLVYKMFTMNPTKRITVEAALDQPYLARLHDLADEPICEDRFFISIRATSSWRRAYQELELRGGISTQPGVCLKQKHQAFHGIKLSFTLRYY